MLFGTTKKLIWVFLRKFGYPKAMKAKNFAPMGLLVNLFRNSIMIMLLQSKKNPVGIKS